MSFQQTGVEQAVPPPPSNGRGAAGVLSWAGVWGNRVSPYPYVHYITKALRGGGVRVGYTSPHTLLPRPRRPGCPQDARRDAHSAPAAGGERETNGSGRACGPACSLSGGDRITPNVNIGSRRGAWGNRVSPRPRPARAWGNRVSPCPHPREGLGGLRPPRNNRMFIAALCGGAAWTSDYINEKMGGPGPPKKMIHYRAQRRGNSTLALRGHVTTRVCRRRRKGVAARSGLPRPRQRYRHGISAAALPRGDGHGNSTAPGDRSPRGESHDANLRPESGRTPPASRSDPPASNSRRGPGTARWLPH